MDDFLRALYYDPASGLKSSAKLLHEAKKQRPDVKLKDVKEFLKTQAETQINRVQPYSQSLEFKFTAPRGAYQADITFLPKYSKVNRGYNGILCVIEIPSRKAYVVPLKTKSATDMAAALADIIKRVDMKIASLGTDNGKEFLNDNVQKLVKKHDIDHYTCDPEDHRRMAIVERFNRTLKTMLVRYFVARRYINGLMYWTPL